MHHLFRPLRKLQWQLSLSYILVVVVAIPILLGTNLALVALSASLPPAQQLAQLLTREVVPQVPRPLTGTNADTHTRLNTWAVSLMEGQNPVKAGQAQQVPQLNATKTLAVLVFDATGQLVGSDPIIPATFATDNVAGLARFLQKIQFNAQVSQQVIQAAFANDQRLANLVSTQADGQTLAAVPVLDQQQSVSGVLLVAVRGLRNDPHASTSSAPLSVLSHWLPGGASQPTAFLPYALLLLLMVSVIGTIFGIITARRITRRLQRITSVAHAWSLGNFQANVHDRSTDELGQLAQDLNRMALQVQHLLEARQHLASLEERQRVARDLHDSVKQQTFALTLLIGAAQSRLPDDPASAGGSLRQAGELADHIRQELTSILQQLRPVALAEQGLQAALSTYTHQWMQQTGIACEFQISGPPGALVLHPEVEEALFRLSQEALANAARHSQANQVHVQVELGAEQVCLRVSDNGRGFAVEQAIVSGHGLANMRERIEAHGGTLTINSAPSETLITSCIPLTQEASPRKPQRKRVRI